MKNKIIKLLLVFLLLFTLIGCNKKISTGFLPVIKDDEFGDIYVVISKDDFFDLGFELGDSVDVEISNGVTLKDLPFYDGHYGYRGDELVISYKSYPYIKINSNSIGNTFNKYNLDENKDTIKITLKQRGKYLKGQESFSISYSNDRNEYDSDVAFANYREMVGGNLKEKTFYRSASPCNDINSRAKYVDSLMSKDNIEYIIDLADNENKISSYLEQNVDNPYWKQLYANNKVYLAGMNADYGGEDFINKAANVIRAILQNDGPFLIHCTEGKDRTGYICALIEILADASLDELINDYMITYDNYYNINKDTDIDKYDRFIKIQLFGFLNYLCGQDCGEEVKENELKHYAEEYLKKGGLTQEEIGALKEKLKN